MTHADTPANLTAAARAAVAAIVSGPAPDADVLAALAPVLAVRHLMTPDGIACGTADQLAAAEFTAERVTCPACRSLADDGGHLSPAPARPVDVFQDPMTGTYWRSDGRPGHACRLCGNGYATAGAAEPVAHHCAADDLDDDQPRAFLADPAGGGRWIADPEAPPVPPVERSGRVGDGPARVLFGD